MVVHHRQLFKIDWLGRTIRLRDSKFVPNLGIASQLGDEPYHQKPETHSQREKFRPQKTTGDRGREHFVLSSSVPKSGFELIPRLESVAVDLRRGSPEDR